MFLQAKSLPLLGYLPNLPPSIGLDLSNSQLSGTIPPSLAHSLRLYRLNLTYNSISGSIPVSLTKSPSLVFLALPNTYSNLSGSIPLILGVGNGMPNKSYQLMTLTLDHNLLSRTIPFS